MELTKEQAKRLLLNYKDKVYFLKGEDEKEIIVITPVQQHTIRYLGKIDREYQIEVNGRLVYIPKEDTVFMIGFDYTLVLDGILFHVVKNIGDFDVIVNGSSALLKGRKIKNHHYVTSLKSEVTALIRSFILVCLMLYVEYLNLGYAKSLLVVGILWILFMITMFIYGSAQEKAKKENDI